MYGQKKKFSTFSYKLVQISPIMTLVNSGAFLSISSWFCELTELIFVMIPYISSTGCPPTRKGLWDMWKWRIENFEFIVSERVQVNPDYSRAMSAFTFLLFKLNTLQTKILKH